MEQNLILEAFKFMILGMVVVFFFLSVLVFAIKIQAFLINKFFSKKENESSSKNTIDQAQKVAAIIAAVQHHNNKKG